MAKDMKTKSSVGIVDENELMLELSIGGIFRKSNQKGRDIPPALNVLQSEVRRKREDKSVGFGSVSGPFREWLDEVLEMEPARKKERIGNSPENNVGRIDEPIKSKEACRSFRPYRDGKVVEDENSGSAFSDSQCSSRQGGATDDSRSNSSNSQLDQQVPTTSAASHPSGQPTESSIPTLSTNKLTDSTVSNPGPLRPNYQSTPPDSSLSNPPSKLDPPATQQATFLARMPCVSTTGNGPNGKTVSGFLYRYTKNEVSIMCVCHGRSFSPAGFVEHAGGVDIVHPLKHITMFPTAFAS